MLGAYAFADLTQLANFLLFPNLRATVLWGFIAIMWYVPLIVAVVLWWLSPVLARLACRGMSKDAGFPGLGIEKLTHAAFVVAGVWIVVFSIVALIQYGLQTLMHGDKDYVDPTMWTYLVAYGVRCLFGVVLVIGARRLARFLLYLRTAGTEHEPSS